LLQRGYVTRKLLFLRLLTSGPPHASVMAKGKRGKGKEKVQTEEMARLL
jgi:hypothetical protein